MRYFEVWTEVAGSAEWAGNLNVWFDTAPARSVEAHRALDLKVAAGRRTAMSVYLPRAKAGFDFAIAGAEAGWTAEIVFRPGWREAMFIIGAPAAGNCAPITLLVTRRADGHVVPVEFTFQSVKGSGTQLGCVRV
jgi:hypothetical protein